MSILKKINCDNCSAPYTIDLEKLTKEKTKITCRRCEHKIIVYKSALLEPIDEKAQIQHDDEKTLVEDEPKVQQEMPNIATAVSAEPPPLSLRLEKNTDRSGAKESLQGASSKTLSKSITNTPISSLDDVSDPTIRRESLSNSSPAIARHSVQSSKASVATSVPVTQATTSKSTPAPITHTGMSPRHTMQIAAGSVVLGLLGVFGQYLLTDPTLHAASFLLSIASLCSALLMLVTSDFGMLQAKLGLSIGTAMVLTAIVGGRIFFVNTLDSTETVEISKNDVKTALQVNEVTVKEEDATEEKAKEEIVVSNTKTNSASTDNDMPTTSRSSSPENAQKNTEEVLRMMQDYNQKEDAKEAPPKQQKNDNEFDLEDDPLADRPAPVSNTTTPSKPIATDLDLDEEDSKKGFFGKKSEPKPEPKPEPKSAPTKADIPKATLDSVILPNAIVRSCYMNEHKDKGTIPKSVSMEFTLQPNGSVTTASITSGPYVGTSFEGCLRTAFKTMKFPISGLSSPTKVQYNLIVN